jgi:hypothetical protein
MPLAFVFESDDLDLARYDAVMKAIGRESLDGPWHAGAIAHFAGPRAEGGWRIVDIWESEAAAAACYGSKSFQQALGPAAATIAPSPWPLHRTEIDQALRQID